MQSLTRYLIRPLIQTRTHSNNLRVTMLDLQRMRTNEVTVTFDNDDSLDRMLKHKSVIGYDRKLRTVEVIVTTDGLEALKEDKGVIKITPLFYSYVI